MTHGHQYKTTPRPLGEIIAEIQERAARDGAYSPARTSRQSRHKSFLATSPDSSHVACCRRCRGQGWLYVQSSNDAPRLVRCDDCADHANNSGLTEAERAATIAHLKDLPSDSKRVAMALRVVGQAIVEQSRGFVCVFGGPGAAKSLWAKAIVATFARNGVQARYAHGKEVERTLFGDSDGDGAKSADTIRREFWTRQRVLVIDEIQAINWRSDWVANEISHIIDSRYRRAADPDPQTRQVTIMVAQYDPARWAPEWIVSRMTDGQFSVPWPESVVAPPCLHGEGVVRFPFFVDMPDVRSVRPSVMAAPVGVA